MDTKHTPEPWIANTQMDGRHHALAITTAHPDFAIEREESQPYHPLLASVHHGRGGPPRPIAEANAKRIVDCVNLLAPHPDLTAIEVIPREALEKVRSALNAFLQNSDYSRQDYDLAREALALLTNDNK